MQPNYGAQPQYGMQPNQNQYGANPNQQPQYGMQPNQNQYGANPNQQPQYGVQPNQPQYGAPNQQPQYGTQPPPNQGYGAPTQQPNQPNPYANNPAPTQTQTAAADDDGKEIYEEPEKAGGDPWKFEPEWDDVSDLKAKTACCCCSCAFDDCTDWAQIQCSAACLCIDSALSWKLFQCQDQSQRACCLNTQKIAMCDMTNDDPDVMCSLYYCGINGIFCLCCSGRAYESICHPCKMPDTCCKQLCQMMCIHVRVALPCDDDVPFEIGCCGFMIKEEEKQETE